MPSNNRIRPGPKAFHMTKRRMVKFAENSDVCGMLKKPISTIEQVSKPTEKESSLTLRKPNDLVKETKLKQKLRKTRTGFRNSTLTGEGVGKNYSIKTKKTGIFGKPGGKTANFRWLGNVAIYYM